MSNDKQWRHSRGVCARCCEQDAYTIAGRWLCAECAARQAATMRENRAAQPEKYREANRRYRAGHKAQGLCTCCSRPALPGLTVCLEHRLAVNRAARAYREKNRPEGLKCLHVGVCRRCGAPALPGQAYCGEHYAQVAEHCRQMAPESKEGHPWNRDNEIAFGSSARFLHHSGSLT